MEEQHNAKWIVIIVAFLIAGFAGGYFYGVSKGETQGREALLAEQAAEKEKEKEEAKKKITETANPFQETNPLGEGYQNPFEGGTINPFAQ